MLVVAVVIGILLLNKVDDTPGRQISAGDDGGDDTAETTTTAPPPPPTTVAPRPPREVKVLSANGTKVSGAAGKVRDVLKAQGYNVLAPTEAKEVEASAVYFAPGFEREAQAVAQALKLPPGSVQPLPAAAASPVADVRGANVVAVVGPDLARQGGPATTTTTRRTTTTRDRG